MLDYRKNVPNVLNDINELGQKRFANEYKFMSEVAGCAENLTIIMSDQQYLIKVCRRNNPRMPVYHANKRVVSPL